MQWDNNLILPPLITGQFSQHFWIIHSFLQWLECHLLSHIYIASTQFFPISLPSANLELCGRVSVRPSPALINAQPGGPVSSLRWSPGSRGRGGDGGRVSAALGEQGSDSWSNWNIHGRLLLSTKINGDLTAQWQTAWAFIPWTSAPGWWLLYSSQSFRRRHNAHWQ